MEVLIIIFIQVLLGALAVFTLPKDSMVKADYFLPIVCLIPVAGGVAILVRSCIIFMDSKSGTDFYNWLKSPAKKQHIWEQRWARDYNYIFEARDGVWLVNKQVNSYEELLESWPSNDRYEITESDALYHYDLTYKSREEYDKRI